MRHTMATLMLAAGVHPKIVQERLGHASIQMTLDRYSHVSMTMQVDATALLDAMLTDQARPKRGHDAG
jgi:integrase